MRSPVYWLAPAYSGVLLALYMLVGRWSFGRELETSDVEVWFLLEPRLWVVLLLMVPALMRIRPAQRLNQPKTLWATMALFFSYLLLSAFWAPRSSLVAAKAYDVALVAAGTFAIARVFGNRNAEKTIHAFWVAALAISLGLGIVALTKIATGQSEGRLAVLGGGPNVFGRIMALSLLAALHLRSRGYGAALLPGAVLALLLLLLSGSRGSFVAFLGSLLVYFGAELKRPVRLVGTALAVSAMSWGALTFTDVGQAAFAQYDARVQRLLIDQRYTAGRDDLFASALALGSEAPVFGRGLGAFPALGLGVYPHNIFLEVFAEGGGVGVAIFCALLALAARALFSKSSRSDGASLAAFAMILIASQFSGDFFDSRGVFAFLVIAVLVARSRADRSQRPASDMRAGPVAFTPRMVVR